jgi:hypothetical protein
LLWKDKLLEKLSRLWIEIDDEISQRYWLEWIMNSNDTEWYRNLFNVSLWWWTHNISSTINAFQNAINVDSSRAVSPKDHDPNFDYAIRTSLFSFIDGEKICIRTDAKKEKTQSVEKAITWIRSDIDHLLVTWSEDIDSDGLFKHLIPTNFEKNVFESVYTVVFNCEDKEAWKVIKAVINDAKNLLEKNHLTFPKKIELQELYKDLLELKNELDHTNSRIVLLKEELKEKKNSISRMNSMGVNGIELETKILKLSSIENWLLNLSDIRINKLKEILVKMIKITKLKETQNNNIINIDRFSDWDIWRVSLVTNWWEWSVWFLEAYNHSIFFTNGILEIDKNEEKLFQILNKLSKWNIDLNITDQTWCWDSSTAAALMIREKQWKQIRQGIYTEIFREMKLPSDDIVEGLSIAESYFLSTLQKVVSWIVFHCKKSNLWDIPNSEKIAKFILKYVNNQTREFILDWLPIFLYWDTTSSRKGRNYKWFNIYNKSRWV